MDLDDLERNPCIVEVIADKQGISFNRIDLPVRDVLSAFKVEETIAKRENKDKEKNKINDQTINGFKVRFQNIIDLPFKDLRKLIDEGKKEIGEGLVIIYAINDNKVGLAVGVTKTLEEKFDAVKIVRVGSEVIGGKGGGGRIDFAQAGGTLPDKIQESFESIKKLIN